MAHVFSLVPNLLNDNLLVNIYFFSVLISEQLIGQLSHYELVIPTLVNRKGEFLSYKLEAPDEEEERAPQTTHRKKRYVYHRTGSADFQPHSVWQDRVFYKLSAYGHDFKFNLTLNRKLVSRNFVVEYWDSNGVKKRHYNMHRCHFIGYSSEPYKSETALSSCHGLVSIRAEKSLLTFTYSFLRFYIDF